jgi:hypothetical protein
LASRLTALIGSHINIDGCAFLRSLISKREEENNHLYLNLFSSFKGGMVLSLQDGKPLKMQQTLGQNKNKQ